MGPLCAIHHRARPAARRHGAHHLRPAPRHRGEERYRHAPPRPRYQRADPEPRRRVLRARRAYADIRCAPRADRARRAHDLKDRGKTQELRDQAQAVVRRVKGLRDKGNLAAGVKLPKTITVQTEAREVDVRGVLDWLDPAVPDDRLLAAALRLQSDHPAGSVLLVTSDSTCRTRPTPSGCRTSRRHQRSPACAPN